MKADENEPFASGVAQNMIGQITKDGWTVVEAKNEDPQTILLTLEKKGSDE